MKLTDKELTQSHKVWALCINNITHNDALWLQGLDVEVKCEPLANKVYSSGNKITEYVTGYKIDVITTCDRQETMLKLKYGHDLILISKINICSS